MTVSGPYVASNWRRANWQLLARVSGDAGWSEYPDENGRLGVYSFVTEVNILLVGVGSVLAKPHWQYGGLLRGGYPIAGQRDRQFGTFAAFAEYKLYLRHYRIVYLPPTYDGTYVWEIIPPYWFGDCQYEIYQWAGEYFVPDQAYIDNPLDVGSPFSN
ncbi:hypothetical protein [Thermosynechococcus sp. JY1331]|uniref:hypothetical protein n=1 Tax=Thermosynechococcus sp. JY1331 TaxID=3074098 RepID=UPI0028780C96|nr:hypothetical protein [Thermosynechococcus sp. JY1331]WNC54411.1 hypothetical protein RHJ31_08410 [Thermosynechococcus sp. JY1331]